MRGKPPGAQRLTARAEFGRGVNVRAMLTAMIRLLVWIALIGGFIFVGSTVKLGRRTFFGHIRAIWHTEEVQELKDGVTEKAGPAAEKVKRGVEAGYKAMTDDDKHPTGSGSATPAPATP